MLKKLKNRFSLFQIVILFLSGVFVTSAGFLLIDKNNTANAATTYTQTWTPTYDSDYQNYFVDSNDKNWRFRCNSTMTHASGICSFSDANSRISGTPATVVKWSVSGSVGSTNFTESWSPSSVSGTNYHFKTIAKGGPTGGEDHTLWVFTGNARLTSDKTSLEYQIYVNPDADEGACDSVNQSRCMRWLRFGQDPVAGGFPVYPSSDRIDFTQDELLLWVWTEIEEGEVAGWQVTGSI